MSEPQVIHTLKEKRAAIESALKSYEAKAEQCRRDLAHVNATLALFAVGECEPSEIRAYMDTSRLFRRGELSSLCKASLASHGPQDTRELARLIAEAKGLDAADPVLRKALAYRIVQALTLQWKRGGIGSEGIRKGVRVWAIKA